MGNVGIIELVLILFSLTLWIGGLIGVVLGVWAFFKVRRLEKLVAELQLQINVTRTPL
jgi:hypothetical protein